MPDMACYLLLAVPAHVTERCGTASVEIMARASAWYGLGFASAAPPYIAGIPLTLPPEIV
jgi:hypothetical protein